jgi:hypothetical protein
VGGFPLDARIWEATITEDRIAALNLSADGRLHLTFNPWQVRTLLWEKPV